MKIAISMIYWFFTNYVIVHCKACQSQGQAVLLMESGNADRELPNAISCNAMKGSVIECNAVPGSAMYCRSVRVGKKGQENMFSLKRTYHKAVSKKFQEKNFLSSLNFYLSNLFFYQSTTVLLNEKLLLSTGLAGVLFVWTLPRRITQSPNKSVTELFIEQSQLQQVC